jgi:hypothetical protein
MGMGGMKDWQLVDLIRRDEYTFVTNNKTDFVALYKRQEVHAGLVIIVPNVEPNSTTSRRWTAFVACGHAA